MKLLVRLLFPCLLISPALSGQRCDRVLKIDPKAPAFPAEKPGFQLIFSDEFDGQSLDTLKWDKSNPTDDYPDCLQGYMANPRNVSVENGFLKLNISADSCGGCPASYGEVKTFDANDQFKAYQFLPRIYLEIRAKLVFGGNVGCAGWLYFNWPGKEYREIDLWETRPTRPDRFQCNRHIDGVRQSPRWICVEDLQGRPLNLGEHFVTFGLDWSPRRIRFYLNGQLCRDLRLRDNEKPFDLPMNLRIGGGPPSLNRLPFLPDSLPRAMLIDYVRVFARKKAIARPFHIAPSKIRTGEGLGFAIRYFPKMKIKIEAPGFSIERVPHGPELYYWATPEKSLPADRFHFLKIRTELETGVREDWIYPIYIEQDFPPDRTFAPFCPRKLMSE